jgi:excisionase family DNA binding protein
MNDDLLKAVDVAKMLGCHQQTAYKMAASGVLPSLKLGKWRRFRAADIAAWLVTEGGSNDK